MYSIITSYRVPGQINKNEKNGDLMSDDKYLMTSLSNALLLIDVLSKNDNVSIAQLQKLTGFGKTTLFKMLYTLQRGDFVYKTSNAKYGLSMKFARLGNLRLEKIDILTVARKNLRELCDELSETVHLAVLSDDYLSITFVGKEICQTSYLHMGSRIGIQLPSYATAVGKAMLAHLSDSVLERVFMNHEFKSLTGNTVGNYNDLLKAINDVRQAGYAMDKEESEIGLSCLGVAIKGVSGLVLGAISVSGATNRMTPNFKQYVDALLRTSSKISRKMGFEV